MIDNVGMPKGPEVAPNEGPSGKRFSRFYPDTNFSRQNRSRAIEAAEACLRNLVSFQDNVTSLMSSGHDDTDDFVLKWLDVLNERQNITQRVDAIDPLYLEGIAQKIRSIDAARSFQDLLSTDAVLSTMVQWLVVRRHFNVVWAQDVDALKQNLEAAQGLAEVVSKSRRKKKRSRALEEMATIWRDSESREREISDLEDELWLHGRLMLKVFGWTRPDYLDPKLMSEIPRPPDVSQVLLEMAIARALRFIPVQQAESTFNESEILALTDPGLLTIEVHRTHFRDEEEPLYWLDLRYPPESVDARGLKLRATGIDWGFSDHEWVLGPASMLYLKWAIVEIFSAMEVSVEPEDIRFPIQAPPSADPLQLMKQMVGPNWEQA